MNEYKNLAIRALEQMRGDDLARARVAYKNMPPELMQKQCGLSGKTHAELLAEYESHESKINAAIQWVKDAT